MVALTTRVVPKTVIGRTRALALKNNNRFARVANMTGREVFRKCVIKKAADTTHFTTPLAGALIDSFSHGIGAALLIGLPLSFGFGIWETSDVCFSPDTWQACAVSSHKAAVVTYWTLGITFVSGFSYKLLDYWINRY